MGKVSGLLVMDHAKISHNYHGTLALAIRRCIRPYVCEMCEGGRFAFCLLDKLSSLVSHYHGDQTFYLRGAFTSKLTRSRGVSRGSPH